MAGWEFLVFILSFDVIVLWYVGRGEAITAGSMKERYGVEPGFITMNIPELLFALDEAGVKNPIVCANINKIGFRICGCLTAYEQAL